MKTTIQSIANLPSLFGNFKIVTFENLSSRKEDLAIIKGSIFKKENVLIRIQSECLTSEVFGSRRCDCREQLEEALGQIEEAENGIVLYLRQEGRGIGIAKKIKAYALQDQGLDTVEANIALGCDIDARSYTSAAEIIKAFQIKSINILTNNPDKQKALKELGIKVESVTPLRIKATQYNKNYLLTKKEKCNQTCI